MLFSSLSFLLYFLPPVILIHMFLPKRLQNPFLFFASLFFYAWGDARFVPLFFALLIVDWGCGMLLEKTENQGKNSCWPWAWRRIWAACSCSNIRASLLHCLV